MQKRKIIIALSLLLTLTFHLFADENTDQAWQSLTKKDYDKARTFTQKCIKKARATALKQQKNLINFKSQNAEKFKAFTMGVVSEIEDKDLTGINDILTNKELNDVATAYFIEAEIFKGEGKINEAKKYYQEIINNYKDAYCWDPRGWYWKVSDVAQDKLDTFGTKYDYGDYRSETLTTKAWNSLKEKDYKGVELYTQKCQYLYENKAQKIKANISTMPEKGQESINWALNDVATCYFILGERYLTEGKSDLARQMYKKATELGFAVCWDPKGWWWKVADGAKDRIETVGTKYNYEDYKSETLTTKAWKSLEEKDLKGVELYAKKCVYLYEKEANNMKAKINTEPQKGKESENWALNDVATCYFLLGEKLLKEGKQTEAREMYNKAKAFKHAMCWNPKGWYFKVAEAAQDKLETIGTKYDFGDYKSETLNVKAWDSLKEKDYKGVYLYAKKCIYLYMQEAKAMQGNLKSLTSKGQEATNWALNDVATSYFLLGEAYLATGNDEWAKKMYNIAKKFGFAVCWNPEGWYFKISEAAQDRLDTMGTKYNYEDYKSVTLTTKAWFSLKEKDTKGVELYTKKCLYLYENEARNMQARLKSFAPKGEESDSWALNDIATCYFLLGEIYLQQGKDGLAKQMYKKATECGFAVCWNPKGWYWKVAEVSQDKLNNYGTGYDYGDYRSVTLANKAWECLDKKDYKGAELYAKKCVYLFGDKAKEMQSQLTEYAKRSFIPYYWALNDVGTCYFILGEAYKQQGNMTKAKEMYQEVINNYSYSQCWDPRGWYWKVAKDSREKLNTLP